MVKVQHRAPSGQGSDPSVALACLDNFLEAASALDSAWDRVLDRGTYPAYLPSFDEFVNALFAWRDEVKDRLAVEDQEVNPVNLADPQAVRAWVKAMRSQVEDMAGAGEDATRPLGQRRLGRMMARRTVVEARDACLLLLRAAESGIG